MKREKKWLWLWKNGATYEGKRKVFHQCRYTYIGDYKYGKRDEKSVHSHHYLELYTWENSKTIENDIIYVYS